jgi:hypothetical protein
MLVLAAVVGLLVPSVLLASEHVATSSPIGRNRSQDAERRLQHQRQGDHEHQDASGRVRPDLWRQGVQQMSRQPIAAWRPVTGSRSSVGSGAPVAGPTVTSSTPLQGVEWTQVGPSPLRIDQQQQFQGTGPEAGEVVDIAVDPRGTTDQVIFVASNDGGIWKSSDGGKSWATKTDRMPSLSMGAVALDPGNPSIVYAGTGNIFDGGITFSKGVGIYKSTDDGDTWSVVPGSASLVNRGARVNRIVLPSPNTLLVATDQGLFRSVDGGANFGANAPAFNDGNPLVSGYISGLALDTANPSTTIYASVSGTGVLVSTDGGATFPASSNLFTTARGGPSSAYGYITFAQSATVGGSPSNQTMFVALAAPGPPGFSRALAGLFKSTNGGTKWTQMTGINATDTYLSTNFNNTKCQCGYDEVLSVDPLNDQRVYFDDQEVFVSTDGGTTFGTPGISENKIHWDNHALTFSPPSHRGTSAPAELYVGTDGGLSRTTDGGGTWTNLNEGVATNLMQSIDIGRGSSTNNAYTYGGMQDTGISQRRPGYSGNDWHLGDDGDGGTTVVDPSNPSVAYSTDDGGLSKTTTAGGDSSTFGWGVAVGTGLPQCGNPPSNCGVNVIAIDPNSTSRVYVGTGPNGDQLFFSTDGATNVSLMKAFNKGTGISAIGNVGLDSNVLWVGFGDGTLQYTTNALAGAAATWTSVTVPGIIAGQGVSGIAIDPTNTAQLVVTYPGFSTNPASSPNQHVFLTTNNGTNWSDISGTNGGSQNLPNLPVHSVVIDPGTSPHTIIVANDAGVLRTIDQGATWQVYGVGLPLVDSKSLAIDTTVNPPVLRLGTYGRSTYELTLAQGPLLAVNADLAFGTVGIGNTATRIVQLFNVGSSDLHISSFSRISGSTDFSIISGPPTPVTLTPGEEIDYTIQYTPTTPGPATATFSISSDDPTSPDLLQASGTGATGIISVSPTSLDFGTVARGTTADRTVTVYNAGQGTLHVSSVTMAAGSDPSYSVVGPTGAQTIPPGAEVLYTIRFSPPANSGPGTLTGSVTISSDDPSNPTVNVPVTGRVGVPTTSVNTNALAFGAIPVDNRTVPSTADQVLKIANQSSCPGCDLHITSLPITGPNAAEFTLVGPPSLPATVAAGGELDVTVRFDPSGPGSRTAVLTVNSDDPVTPSIAINLNGTGLLPGISPSPSPLIFGPTVFDPACGTKCGITGIEQVTNNGLAELILDVLSFTGNSFSGPAATNPPTRVVPGGMFSEQVTFHPIGGPARKVTGVLHIEDSLPLDPGNTVATDVPLCGESVGRGIRVLVVDRNGNPVSNVGALKLNSVGVTPPNNVNLKKLPLKTIDPPTSCQRIQFQYENQNLASTNQSAPRGSYYSLSVTVGNHHSTQTFTLAVNEFKILVVTVG